MIIRSVGLVSEDQVREIILLLFVALFLLLLVFLVFVCKNVTVTIDSL
jgi:uncharacterized integral membrane protein